MVSATYKESGVDIFAAEQFMEKIAPKIRTSWDERVVSGLSAFASLYDLGNGKLLSATADGVGTKLQIAMMMNSDLTLN